MTKITYYLIMILIIFIILLLINYNYDNIINIFFKKQEKFIDLNENNINNRDNINNINNVNNKDINNININKYSDNKDFNNFLIDDDNIMIESNIDNFLILSDEYKITEETKYAINNALENI